MKCVTAGGKECLRGENRVNGLRKKAKGSVGQKKKKTEKELRKRGSRGSSRKRKLRVRNQKGGG